MASTFPPAVVPRRLSPSGTIAAVPWPVSSRPARSRTLGRGSAKRPASRLAGRPAQSRRRPAVAGPRGVLAADPIDPASRLRLADAGGRAVLHVPSPGVEHEQAAVRVLQHVGGVEVRVVRGQEILVLAPPGRPVRDEDVTGDLVACCAGP